MGAVEATLGRPRRPAEPRWQNIPEALTGLPRWVGWSYQNRDGKWTKPPLQPDGSAASSTDPETWSQFDFIQTAYLTGGNLLDGVGIVVNGDGLCGGDFDHVLDPSDGRIMDPKVMQYIRQLDTYTEISPSGVGLRQFFYAKLPAGGCKAGPIEFYDTGRYLTVTGRHYPGTPRTVNQRQQALELVHAAVFAERIAKREAAAARNNGASSQLNLDDRQILKIAREARNGDKFVALYDRGDCSGFASQSEAELSLCSMLAFYCRRDPAIIDRLFRGSSLYRQKWERADYRGRTIASAIDGCAEIYTANGRVHTEVLPSKDESAGGSRRHSDAQDRPPADSNGETTKLNAKAPFDIADHLLETHFERDRVRTLYYWQGAFWRWNGSQFAQTDELLAIIGNYLHTEVTLTVEGGKSGPRTIAPHQWHTRNVYEALTARAHLASATKPPVWLGKAHAVAHVVACGNGLLDLETLKLEEPTPAYFNLTSLAAHYRPDAKCSNWLEFLRQLWPNDEQSIECLQEIFGYFLEADNRLQKMFLIIGPTRSGKGTIRAAMEAVLGADSVIKPAITDFTSHFGLEGLIGKLVAIVADARLDRDSNGALAMERMLSISGGDSPAIPRKYLPAFSGPISTCRILLLTNELPGLMDSSGAAAGRFVLLRTYKSFAGSEDPDLFENKLKPERDGIFAWALRGWQRLRKRGHFLIPDSAQGLLENFGELMDALSDFIGDCVEIDPSSIIEKSAVYDAYLRWAESRGIKHPLNRNWFFNKLGSRPGVDCAYRYDERTKSTFTDDEHKIKAPRRVKGIKLR